MALRTIDRFDNWLLVRLGNIPPSAVVPVSLIVGAVVGGVVPALAHLDRVLSGLYAVLGAVLAMLPLLAVIIRQTALDDRRLLLLRSGYAEGIGRLTASEFERLIAAWYEARNYRVELRGRSGDGGIDLVATSDTERIAVQCKHWRTKVVGAAQVRELRGSVIDPDTTLVLVGSGTFSEAARREARDKGVQILDGPALISRLQEVISIAAPRCPQCGGEMRPKNGRRGDFWSCLAYPNCKGSRDMDSPRSDK